MGKQSGSIISLRNFFTTFLINLKVIKAIGVLLVVFFLADCKQVNGDLKEEKLRRSFRERLGLSKMQQVDDKDKKIAFDDFSLIHYKEDKKHYNILAEKSILYTETKMTELKKVKLTLFNNEEIKDHDVILAKKGFIDEAENVTLFKDVKVLFSSKKIDIFAEYLFYNSQTEKITFLTNVVFNNKGGENAVIKGQYFIWHKKDESITSHEKIEVLKDNGDTIVSEGFYSDQEFENTVFTNAVGSTEIETE